MNLRWLFALWLALGFFPGAPTICVSAAEVMVFAAASLTDVLQAAAPGFERSAGDRVVFNFGASSLLARQIQEGAPADVFFSADEARMDQLDRAGLLLAGTRRSLLSNSLVLVVAADSARTNLAPADLIGPTIRRLALADPQSVPAGIYARAFLEKRGWWAAVAPKVVPTANVRAALAAVESGNVDAGIVYRTDAAISHKVRVAAEIPAADTPPISYPIAVLHDARAPDAARKFVAYLRSPAVLPSFRAAGFGVAAPAP